MVPFPLGNRDLPATSVKHDGPAAAGARIERQQQRLGHTCTAARFTTECNGWPAAKLAISAAIIVTPRSNVSCLTPARPSVCTYGSYTTTDIPKATARRATRRPTFP